MVFTSGQRHVVVALAAWLAVSSSIRVSAEDEPDRPTPAPISHLNLEELLQVPVAAVSRESESLSDAPAAVFVLTRSDIRRSGALTIPEALRLVPGVQVGRIDSSKYGISIRGFNGRFANKLLVLVDGRSIYTPLYGGVFWESLDVPLEEVERIEVVRGSGGIMRGTNAVNGVVNIITSHARENSGLTIASSFGSDGPNGTATVLFGRPFGETGAIRAHFKAFDRDTTIGPTPYDQWDMWRAGARLDVGPTGRSWSAEASAYGGTLGQTYPPQIWLTSTGPTRDDGRLSGAHVSLSWQRSMSDISSLTVRTSVDRSHRNEALIGEDRTTADIELQHNVVVAPTHDMVWGVTGRLHRDHLRISDVARYVPESRTMPLASVFAQDSWRLSRLLRLTAGARLEHNVYTGWEAQPYLRLLARPTARQSIWAAVARAVRTPSRLEVDLQAPLERFAATAEQPLPVTVGTETARRLDAERVATVEGGYRFSGQRWSADVALFASHYGNLTRSTNGTPELRFDHGSPFLFVPLVASNTGVAWSRGAELLVGWQPVPRARLTGSYSALHVDAPAPDDYYGAQLRGFDAPQQWNVRLQLDLGGGWAVDPQVRAVGALMNRSADGYVTTDLHLARYLSRSVHLTINGWNLTSGRRLEFPPTVLLTVPAYTSRAVGVRMVWRR